MRSIKWFSKLKSLNKPLKTISLNNSFRFASFQQSQKEMATALARRDQESSLFLRRQKRKPDRFGIFKMTEIGQLLELSQSRKYNLTLNENIAVLYRITELAPSHKLHTIYGIQELLPKIKINISDIDLIDEDPLVGMLMLALKNLDCYNGFIELWIHLQDLIMSDCFDSESDEILHAIIGIDGLEKFLNEEYQKELLTSCFLKIEESLINHLKMMKYEIKNLGIICKLMVHNNRNAENVFEEIEFQVMKALKSKECNIDELINFSYYFSKANYFSINIFEFTNNALINEIEKERKINPTNFKYNIEGNKFAQLIFYWNFFKKKEMSFELSSFLKQWTLNNYFNENNCYTLEDLTNLHSGINLLEINDEKIQNKIIDFLENKLLQIDFQKNYIDLENVENYLRLRAEKEFESKYHAFPNQIYLFFDEICTYNNSLFKHESVFYFANMLENKNIVGKFPNFIAKMPKFVEKHTSDFDFDQICYFYLFSINNSNIIADKFNGEFYNALNNIKEFIKFVSLRRGFKIDLNSNFHKLLNVVDLAQFFEGGES